MAGEEKDFQGAFDRIKAGIGDLSQLNVRTFSGEIKASTDNLPAKGLSIDKFLREATTDGEVQVVGFTDMKIDGDIDQFITSADFPTVIAAHNSAIQAGQQSRRAMMNLFTDAIRDGIKTVKG